MPSCLCALPMVVVGLESKRVSRRCQCAIGNNALGSTKASDAGVVHTRRGNRRRNDASAERDIGNVKLFAVAAG